MDGFKLTETMERCISSCYDCADVCNRTAVHCLRLGGAHAEHTHQTMLHDCADICIAAARLMGRASYQHATVCKVCASICRGYARECAELVGDDPVMRRCIEVCNRCAKTCEQTAAGAHPFNPHASSGDRLN